MLLHTGAEMFSNGATVKHRKTKGTPERLALCQLAGRSSALKRKAKLEEQRSKAGYFHIWLFSKVEENERGCWIFTGSRNSEGYGRVNFLGKCQLAHRVSFKIVNGFLPDSLLVCHKCDTPSCINPQHLFLGTNKENTMDAVRKGRRILVKNL
jgi:hypothetical protein